MLRRLLPFLGIAGLLILCSGAAWMLWMPVLPHSAASTGHITVRNQTGSVVFIDRMKLYNVDGLGRETCPDTITIVDSLPYNVFRVDADAGTGAVSIDARDRLHLNAGIIAACRLGWFNGDWTYSPQSEMFNSGLYGLATASRRSGLSYRQFDVLFGAVFPPPTELGLIMPDGSVQPVESPLSPHSPLPEASYQSMTGEFVAFDFPDR